MTLHVDSWVFFIWQLRNIFHKSFFPCFFLSNVVCSISFQDIYVDVLVGSKKKIKGVNFGNRSEVVDMLREVGVTFDDGKDEELSQKALVDILFEKGCLSKEEKFKQLSNMSSSKGWKARCRRVQNECYIPSIRVSELIEEVLMFEIRQNDGHEGFYAVPQLGFAKPSENMYGNQTEMDRLVQGFAPQRNSIQVVMDKLNLGIPKETVKMIANAFEYGAYHMILPDDIDHILESVGGRRGKYASMLKDLLTILKNDTLKFAKVQEYAANGPHGKFHYYDCDAMVDTSLNRVDIEERGVVEPVRNNSNEIPPSSPKQTTSLLLGRNLPPVTPEEKHSKRGIGSGAYSQFQSPGKKGTFYPYRGFD